jgi:hypothetical protein
MLTLIDEYTRECLAIGAARRLGRYEVLEALADVMLFRGIPEHIRSDNGREFVAKELRKWQEAGNRDAVYRTRKSVGKRVLRELQRDVTGQVPERRDFLFVEGGAGHDRKMASRVQHAASARRSATGRQPPRPVASRVPPNSISQPMAV